MPRATRRTESGFTLLELLIVVAIIAIVSALLIGVNSRTYGSNSKNVSEQLAATLNTARMRSIATRRIHRVFIKPQELQVWAADATGLVDDGDASDDLFVERVTTPHGVSVYDVDATVHAAAGQTATQNAALNYEMKFKPDGTSGGGTLFVRDTNGSEYRVLVYRATGSVYARENW